MYEFRDIAASLDSGATSDENTVPTKLPSQLNRRYNFDYLLKSVIKKKHDNIELSVRPSVAAEYQPTVTLDPATHIGLIRRTYNSTFSSTLPHVP